MGIAATLPLDRSEWLRESKPGSVLLSDDLFLFLQPRASPHSRKASTIFDIIRHAEIESPADDWVRTGVCTHLSGLRYHDWLSISLFSRFVPYFSFRKRDTFYLLISLFFFNFIQYYIVCGLSQTRDLNSNCTHNQKNKKPFC